MAKLPRTTIGQEVGERGLKQVVTEFLAGDDRRLSVVYQVFTLAVWWEQIVERSGNVPVHSECVA